MAYTVRTTDNAGDLGRAADQNESVDNDAWLYANLATEILPYGPDRPSAAVGADSDEFASTTLNIAWTAIGGLASGTVNELETGAVDKYDLATFPHWLAIQTDDDNDSASLATVGFRKAFTPGTGPWTVIARVAIWKQDDPTDSGLIGFMVSDDTTPTNYTNLMYGVAKNDNPVEANFRNQGGQLAQKIVGTGALFFHHAYIAMMRETAGGATTAYFSLDGLGWSLVGTTATATTVAYLWIGVRQQLHSPRAIYMIDWIRTFPTATLICGRGGNT